MICKVITLITLQCLIIRLRPLMYKKNSKGPRTDPCQTPAGIDEYSEL